MTWRSTVSEVRESTWRAALEEAHGCITHAAYTIGIHRSHGMRLTKEYELTEYARLLRLDHGLPATGRPKNATPRNKRLGNETVRKT